VRPIGFAESCPGQQLPWGREDTKFDRLLLADFRLSLLSAALLTLVGFPLQAVGPFARKPVEGGECFR
jgi:hypothetical protein